MNTESVLEKIEKSLHDLPSNADLAEIRDRVMQIEQKGSMRQDFHTGTPTTLGAQVATKFQSLRDTYESAKSVTFKVPLELKTLLGTVGSTYTVQNHATVPGLSYAGAPPETLLMGAIPHRPMPGVTTAHYSRYLGSSINAGVQPGEGGLKAETVPNFSPIAQNSITVAGTCPITEQALKTSGELEAVVNGYLADQVQLAIDGVLVGGTAEIDWPFTGLKALATAYPSTTYTEMADTIAEVVAHMRWTGMRPNIVVLNPMEYLGLVLAKNIGGDYLTGTYLAEMPLVVHGCRVVFSSGVNVGEALILDTRHIELGFSTELEITVGLNSDDFVRNKRTIRAEAGIIPIYRHYNAARLATPKAAA